MIHFFSWFLRFWNTVRFLFLCLSLCFQITYHINKYGPQTSVSYNAVSPSSTPVVSTHPSWLWFQRWSRPVTVVKMRWTQPAFCGLQLRLWVQTAASVQQVLPLWAQHHVWLQRRPEGLLTGSTKSHPQRFFSSHPQNAKSSVYRGGIMGILGLQ